MVGPRAAAAVADRPGVAPALSGPTCSMPASSTGAIEPPPAPMVWTSTIGTWIGIAYSSSRSLDDRRHAAQDQRDVARGAAHVVGDDVGESPARPGLLAVAAAAMTPEAGPDITVLTACSATIAGRDGAAVALHHQQFAREAAPRQLALQPLDIAMQHRLDRGVPRCRHAPLVLAVFRDDGVAGGDVAVRPDLARTISAARGSWAGLR